jgi:hypothetical protein
MRLLKRRGSQRKYKWILRGSLRSLRLCVEIFRHFKSFLLNKITPTIATNSSTETTSNGKT